MPSWRPLLGLALLASACAAPQPAAQDDAAATPWRLVAAGSIESGAAQGARLCWSVQGTTLGVQTQSWTGFWQQGESGLRTLDRAMDLGPGFGGDTFLVRDADGLAVLRGRDLELVRRIEGMPPGGSQGIVLPSPDGSRVFAAGGIYPLRLRGSALLEVDADLPARELSSLRSENWVRGAWSADGSRLTTISIGGVHGETGAIELFDAQGPRLTRRAVWREGATPQAMALSPDGSRLLIAFMPALVGAGSLGLAIHELDPETLATRRVLRDPATAHALFFLDEETLLAAPRHEGARLEIWDAETLELLAELDAPSAASLALSPDRRKLAVSVDGQILLYHLTRK